MPRYISSHSLACLTRQGAQHLAERFSSARGIQAIRIQVNMLEGKMLVEFESPERKVLEDWLAAEGFHFDWLMRVEFEWRDGKLDPVP